jgi:tetratricopeptide (TPR) repeat protein
MSSLLERLRAALAPQYEVERELASGGMGTVFLARDTVLDRKVAVKVLRAEEDSPTAAQRLLHEARILARFSHPNVVSIYHAGELGESFYYIMDYVEGETLEERLGQGPLSAEEGVRIGSDVLAALEAAHEHGIVHRDVKPGNVFLVEDRALLGDFGIAKRTGTAATGLTEAGHRVGTPGYMPPEQAAGDEVTPATDLYALGMVLYEALTGRRWSVPMTPVAEADWSGLPRGLVPVLRRALAWAPDERWAYAGEFRQALLETRDTSRLGRLGHAIQRRSFWQVLGTYLVASWIVLMLTRGAFDVLGLPNWFPELVLILLLVGLPVVLATALLQEGTPFISRRDPRVLPDAAAAAVESAGGARRLFTWRNASLAGLIAFAILGIGTGGYMAMRAAGIGPVGSLVAKGVLDEESPIVLADFQTSTGDSGLAIVATQLLRTDLSQSTLIRLAGPDYVARVLARMGKDVGVPLNHDLAREVAIREGFKAVIEGDINSIGERYVVSARLVEAETGRSIVDYRQEADADTAVVEAIDRLSKQLRERIGESLKSIRRNPPLAQVTTSSLQALQRYSQANGRGVELDRMLALLEEAVSIDPAFAGAWTSIAEILYTNQEQPARQIEAMTKAYQLRDRLTDRERFEVVGSYHEIVTADYAKASDAYRNLLDIYPHDWWALNSLAWIYQLHLREYERAVEMAQLAIEADSLAGGQPYYNAAMALGSLGKYDQAQAMLHRARQNLDPESRTARFNEYFFCQLASAQGDYDAAENRTRTIRETVGRDEVRWRWYTSRDLGALALVRGKLVQAEGHFLDEMSVAEERGLAGLYLQVATYLAILDVIVWDTPETGLQKLEAALDRYPLSGLSPFDRPYLTLADAYARARRPDRARALVAEFEAEVDPVLQRRRKAARHQALGVIALAEGQFAEAISEFRLQDDASGCPICALPDLGRAYDLAGQRDSAIAVYERYVTTPYLSRLNGDPFDLRIYGDAFNLALIYERLGKLHKEGGDPETASHFFEKLVELWKDADSVLQPRVQAARGAIVARSPDS